MAVSRAQRRRAREPRAAAEFGAAATAALDVLELMEYAWHDCYGEVAPPDDVIDDVLVCAQGDLGKLVSAARAAIIDFRDVRVAADTIRRI